MDLFALLAFLSKETKQRAKVYNFILRDSSHRMKKRSYLVEIAKRLHVGMFQRNKYLKSWSSKDTISVWPEYIDHLISIIKSIFYLGIHHWPMAQAPDEAVDTFHLISCWVITVINKWMNECHSQRIAFYIRFFFRLINYTHK